MVGWMGSKWSTSAPYRTDVHELPGADVVRVDEEGFVVLFEHFAELVIVLLLRLEGGGGRHLV
jgi:hypothetical protein|tara:strand:+ start:863 stop:1051 length:189 start_codon:yes stop_codon:yes gene_type:complete